MAAVFPVYYGRAPLVDADALSWEDTRPEDDEYWRRVGKLQRRGGFYATARLVSIHSAPGEDPLLAVELSAYRGGYFPELMRPGALDGTVWEGVPTHLSLCFESECPGRLLAEARRRWRRPRRVWVSCHHVSSGATCVLREGVGALAVSRVLLQMHGLGRFRHRPLHVSL